MNYHLSDRPYYCPNCGYFVKSTDKECKVCDAQIKPRKMDYTFNEAFENSFTEYGTSRKWHDWLFDNVISKNKDFDKSSLKFSDIQDSIQKQIADIQKNLDIEGNEQIKINQEREKQKQMYQPHCPICNSPHITKISTTRKLAGAATFGIFSKTARSQWVCKTCGSKF